MTPIKAKELMELSERTSAKMKMLPTMLVTVTQKKANEPTKKKSRIAACGNVDDSEDDKETYAGGADATAVRSAIKNCSAQKAGNQNQRRKRSIFEC